jgi:hypothetical protein
MCEIVQRVWIEEQPNKKTAYVVLRNGQCICMQPVAHFKCSKATQLPKSIEPTRLALPPLHARD